MAKVLQFLWLFHIIYSIGSAEILYVRNTAESADAWQDRHPVYETIQDAIDNANSDDEIWVAKGTYYESIALKEGIRLYGGFVGFEGSNSERILWNLRPVTIINGGGTTRCIQATSNTIIDGFTLCNGGGVEIGAGINIFNETNIIIKNIFIESCSVTWKGSGVFIDTDSTGTIDLDRIVVWNSHSYCGALEMDEFSQSTLTVTNCTIVQNHSYGLELPYHEKDGKTLQPSVWDHLLLNTICWKNVNPYNIHAPNPVNSTHNVWAWAREFIDYSYVGESAWNDVSNEGKWHGPKPNVIFEKNPHWKYDPKFVNPEIGDFRLLNNSPCLDAGQDGADLGAYPSNDITVEVTYYSHAVLVPDAAIELIDNIGNSYNLLTNENGNCLFTNIMNGSAIITFSKENDQRDAISGSDALLILQYLAFLADLTEDQKFAADVTGDGNVSGSDAQAILRYLAFFNDNTGSTGEWRCSPDSSIIIIQKDTTSRAKAFLLGDVNGDWSINSGAGVNNENKSSSIAKIKIGKKLVDSESVFIVPVKIEHLKTALHSAIMTIEYDPGRLTYLATEKTDSSGNFMMVANGEDIGKIHIAMAGVKGIISDSELLYLTFQLKNNEIDSRSSELKITRALINDIRIDQVENGLIFFKNASGNPRSGRTFDVTLHPNPFNSVTTISYCLAEAAHVTLSIFNIQGQLVDIVLDKRLAAGDHLVNWKAVSKAGEPLPAGIYFCHLKIQPESADNTGQIRLTKEMFLLK